MLSYRALQITTPSTDFHKATKVVEIAEVPTPSAGNVIVQNHYVGINTTDINVTNGAYGNTPTPGLEGAGVVYAVGKGVSNVVVNDAVAYQSEFGLFLRFDVAVLVVLTVLVNTYVLCVLVELGAFAEYVEVPAASLIKLPEVSPVVVPLTVCGISASLALEKVGQLGTNETVLVTAAAGGTGQFVVQLAKLTGNHVIGICSSDDKVEHLKSLGVDRMINYSKEDIGTVLKTEYPKGLDLVFESVGSEMFKAVLENMAVRGRVILFDQVSEYQGAKAENPLLFPDVSYKIQRMSVSLRGFFLLDYAEFIPEYLSKLLALVQEGKIKAGVDPTEFKGLEGIADAIDHLFARKNIGKLIVKLAD